jgi:Domain of unknown function (DUF4340)
MRFERDSRDGWTMVDPVRARAEAGVLDLLLKSVLARKGTLVPESERDAKKLGLDPPRFVLELETKSGARQKIEVGAVDLDQRRVHVRVQGRILRALRDFEVWLDQMPDQFKSHAVTELDARDVIEIHRRGKLVLEGDTQPTDLALDALLEEGMWRATSPVEARLDPLTTGLLALESAGLRHEGETDHGGAGLASLGLDPPEMTFELSTLQGQKCVLRFGRRDHAGRWNVMSEGRPDVWEVEAGKVLLLATKLDHLVDSRLVRFARTHIDAVQVGTKDAEVRLEKGLFGWTVAEGRPGSHVVGSALPADKRKVEDLIARIEGIEYTNVQLDKPFAADEAQASIHVRADASIVAGSFGAEYTPESGGRALRFRREGETVVGLVDPDLYEITRVRAKDFWSLSVAEIAEVNALKLKLSMGDVERTYVRNKQGLWVREGAELEARELRPVLDPLFFLRASEHLLDGGAPLVEPIRVQWSLVGDEDLALTIGKLERDGQSVAVVEREGRRSVLARQDLHGALQAVVKDAR